AHQDAEPRAGRGPAAPDPRPAPRDAGRTRARGARRRLAPRDLLVESVTELAAAGSERAEAGPWASIGVQGFAAGRFGAAATAAEYGMRDGTAVSVRMLAAGLVLGPRAVPDAIGRCRDLLGTVPGEDGDLRDALAILLAMSGRYESARDALAPRSAGPGGSAGSGSHIAAAAVEHLAGHWEAVGPALAGHWEAVGPALAARGSARDRPARGLPP